MGVIHGLEQVKTKSRITVFSDSQYVINGIEKGWAEKWRSKNWYRTRTEKATNHDLWQRLLELIATHEKVAFNWIKGHAGHPENERCDELAMLALTGNDLQIDDGYLPQTESSNVGRSSGKISTEGDVCRKCNTPVVKKTNEEKRSEAWSGVLL